MAGTARERRLILPRELPHQRPILLDPSRFKVLACGRRWGKTALGLLATIQGHGPHRGARLGAVDGGNIWWVAPTFTIATKIWRDLRRASRDGWQDKSETERRIVYPGGGSITVRSSDDPDSMRGDGLDGLVIDEAAFVEQRAWRDALRPALSDRLGWAVFISTPNGRNWFHDLWSNAETLDGWRAWQRPSTDNETIHRDEFAAAEQEIGPRAYAQEYEACFTDREGAEFPGHWFSGDIHFTEWPAPDRLRFRVVYVDPSKGKTERSDYSAIVMLGLGWDGTMYVDADIERRDVTKIVDDTLRISKEFSPQAVGIEANQFQEVLADIVVERSRAAGFMLPVHAITNSENKLTRVRATLTPYLSRGEFRFKAGSRGAKMLVAQLEAFPLDKHDDGPDALEGAVRLARHVFLAGR